MEQKQATGTTGIRDAITSLRSRLGLKEKISQGIKIDISELVKDLDLKELEARTNKEAKPWKFPFKWKSIIKASNKNQNKDKLLFFYLNSKKGLIEPPMLLPYQGNMVIYKNKPYQVNPKGIWTVNVGLKQYKCYLYKDYDRRPISSDDYEETISAGYGTEDDELLIKAALEARINTMKANVSKVAIIIGLLVVVGIAIYFFTR